jgi:Xaa-Pro dipeptidase
MYPRLDPKQKHHKLYVNNLFTIEQDLGVDLVWYGDGDPIMDEVGKNMIHKSALGVDKDLPARFLIPLMEAHAAPSYRLGSRALDEVRGKKDSEEQEKMRIVSHINDCAMEQLKGLIHAGVSEKEVASQLLAIYQELGAEEYSFTPIVAFGPHAADPHHLPDDTVLQEGQCILFDVGCKKDMYCSDMTRTFFYKSMSEEQEKVYNLVRKANETAIAQIKPGIKLKEIDRAARKIIEEEGYGPFFNHRLGHFIGLGEHEFGDVSAVNENLIEEGMIFSIEPGIYLKDKFGVRVEDLVLVTKTGCECLNAYSKKSEILS